MSWGRESIGSEAKRKGVARHDKHLPAPKSPINVLISALVRPSGTGITRGRPPEDSEISTGRAGARLTNEINSE